MRLTRNYFRIADAAVYCGVQRKTIRNWVDQGDLDALIINGIWYVWRQDLDNLLDEYELNGTELDESDEPDESEP
ncbi:unnamed protein product [marine sediment metagenome]|uniref:Helix-turn-helix domain-containing protein n=1 Tax=marine sediment metagenome TaxID=412755 RepID=X1KS87_9ZZZZ